MKDLKEILYTKAKVNSCEHIIKTYPFLETTILEAINEALRIHDVVGQSEQYCDDNEITHNKYRLYDGFAYCPDCGQEL